MLVVDISLYKWSSHSTACFLGKSERTAMLSYQIAKIWSSEFVMKRLTAILSKFPSQSKSMFALAPIIEHLDIVFDLSRAFFFRFMIISPLWSLKFPVKTQNKTKQPTPTLA